MESPHYIPPLTSKLNSHRLDFYINLHGAKFYETMPNSASTHADFQVQKSVFAKQWEASKNNAKKCKTMQKSVFS